MITEYSFDLRVRYSEVDPMGYLHHSRFFQYFEMGRVELLRAAGISYADLEAEGCFFVVVKAACQFKSPARYDDTVRLTTRLIRQTYVKIDHEYELKRQDKLLATAQTTIACVGRDGKLREIPPALAGGDPTSLPQ